MSSNCKEFQPGPLCLRATFWPLAPRLGPQGSGLRPWVPRFPPTVTAVLGRQRSMRQCPNAGVNHRPVRTSRAHRTLRESLPFEGRTRTLGFGVYLSGVPSAWGTLSPCQREAVGALSEPPSTHPHVVERSRGTRTSRPREPGARVAPRPLPHAGGRGRGGSRWQQLRLGPSPARSPRPEDRLRELSRVGGAAASAAS